MSYDYKKKYEELVNLLPQTIFEMDTSGNFVFTNQHGHSTFGYSFEDIENGLPIEELFIEQDRARLNSNIHKVLEGKEFGNNEYTATRKDGSDFHVLVYITAIRRNTKILGLRGTIIDINNQKEAEEKFHTSCERFRNLSAHLQSIREEERKIIAREIHDELGQSLTALKMDLIWLNRHFPNKNTELLEKTASMSDIIDSTIRAVRRISTELRPGLIDDLGLLPAIEWYSDEFKNRTNIKCELNFHQNEINLDIDKSIAIFRIFQETLTNVTRHSKASKVIAELDINNNNFFMSIKDNGIGITKEQIEDPKSLGLLGLKERVFPWNGSLNIIGIKNTGTEVKVIIPLRGEND